MDEIMSEQEVAVWLRIDIKTIARARRKGEPVFPFVAIGTSIRYSRAAVLAEFAKWPTEAGGTGPDDETAPARRAGRPRKNK